MSEAQIQERQAQTVVTAETLREFQLGKLGMQETTEQPAPEGEKPAEAQPTPPETPNAQQQEEEIPEDGTMREGEVVFRGKWVKKNDYGYRMHLKTEEVKKERSAREAAEAKIRELEAKSAPQEKKEESGKPDPSQFTDAFEYAEALAEWKVKETIRARDKEEAERKQKEQHAKTVESWETRLSKVKAEIEDFDDVLANTTVRNTDFGAEIQAAIMESEIGPHLLYHFAQNPDVVEKLKGMTVTGALREVGKIEARLEKSGEKIPEKQRATASKAPAPISPVKGTSQATSGDGLFDSKGEFIGTPAQYRQLRKEGKIK